MIDILYRGLAQKYIFSCTPCRKSLKRNLARKYVSSAGIPLVEELKESKKLIIKPKESSGKNVNYLEGSEPKESLEKNVKYLEGRVQILENLLEDYYLDAYFLEKVKDVYSQKPFTRYPVLDQKKQEVIGVLSMKELFLSLAKRKEID